MPERLTQIDNDITKIEGTYKPYDNVPILSNRSTYIQALLNKVGKLEDLEEKFKCPLEIVAKLMLKEIDTIYIIYSDGGYASIYGDLIEAYVGEMFIDGYYIDNNPYKENNYRTGWVIETNFCHIPLEDYGVYWWLKEDKSE